MTFQELVRNELAEARRKFPEPRHSDHEAYALLLEEVDEAWELVKFGKGLTILSPDERCLMRRELAQIAAMAQRWAEDLGYVEGEE